MISSRSPQRGKGRAGFTLIEIMAAVTLLAIIFTTVMQIRAGAMAKATHARALSVASRLGLTLQHRIEAGMVSEIYDGYEGDFSEEGFGDFRYVIGLGDGSQYASGGEDDSESIWRRFRQNEEEDRDEDAMQPEFTRVFITIYFPDVREPNEEESFTLESMIDTWAVYQDFELYRVLWPELLPEAIE
ncbi:MAG: type IV pilus modification PilV family protein [Planctomycetota bacterium]|jgi:prepilin-type N-terminal cleavage/methylation domain-containing protein